jgi:putative inorganic carbon (hco3(-)) transporter
VLWTAALRMLGERPWLGVGPDNFRLRYGPYVGLPQADRRVHTNNMYLELLVGGGLVAGAAMVWLSWRALALLLAVMQQAAGDDIGTIAAGAVAAVTAVALHGLVDSFLSFTATYAVMAISIGLLLACGRMAEAHAHRV